MLGVKIRAVGSIPDANIERRLCWPEGALEKWIGTGREKTQMLEAVAYSCQQAGQVDWASELYLFAGASRPALNLLNLQMSNVLEAAVSSAPQREFLNTQIARKSLKHPPVSHTSLPCFTFHLSAGSRGA